MPIEGILKQQPAKNVIQRIDNCFLSIFYWIVILMMLCVSSAYCLYDTFAVLHVQTREVELRDPFAYAVKIINHILFSVLYGGL